MAIALVADTSLPADMFLRRLDPSHIEAMASLEAEPLFQDRMAYVRLAPGERAGDWFVAMRQLGIEIGSVYIEPAGGGDQAAAYLLKATRPGDTIFLPRLSDLPPGIGAGVIEKGAVLFECRSNRR